jgi:hypothetical protein
MRDEDARNVHHAQGRLVKPVVGAVSGVEH